MPARDANPPPVPITNGADSLSSMDTGKGEPAKATAPIKASHVITAFYTVLNADARSSIFVVDMRQDAGSLVRTGRVVREPADLPPDTCGHALCATLAYIVPDAPP